MMIRIMFAFFAAAILSVAGRSQTITICSGQTVPSGYVTTQIQTSPSCGSGTNNQKTLTYIAGDAFSTQVFACNDGTPQPTGWVILDTPSSLVCGSTFAGNQQQLFNTNGASLGQTEVVCNVSVVPPGWQITQTGIDIVPKCGSSEPSHVGEQITNETNVPPPTLTGLAKVLQWGTQHPAIGHLIGFANTGGTWTVRFPGTQNWLSYGPYTPISTPGDYVAAWSLSVGSNALGPGMGNIDVNDATTQTQIAVRNPALAEFTSTNIFQTLTLPFSVDSTRAGHQFEFRVFWFDNATTSEAVLGYVPLQWNAQNPALGHLVGDPDNSTGFPGWSASVGDGASWLQYGPYVTLQTGTYIPLWTLQIDDNFGSGTNDVICIVDFNDATTQTRLTSTLIHRQDFLTDFTDQVFQTAAVTIDSTRAGHQFEFRIWWNNFAYTRVQAVGVIKIQ